MGDLLASCVQTDFGNIKVRDIRRAGSNGTVMSGLLYIPKTATAKTPAPGIIAPLTVILIRAKPGWFCHRISAAMVLAPTRLATAIPTAGFCQRFWWHRRVKYLRSLDIVDPKNIGMEGHSMGGWAILVGAAVIPDGYKSFIFEGSSTETLGTPKGSATFPRNVELVYSQWG